MTVTTSGCGSGLADLPRALPGSRARQASAARRVELALAALLVLIGLLSLRTQLSEAWRYWTNDPLRSIGIFVPPLSLWLMWRSVSGRDWQTAHGTWWGLLLSVGAMSAALLVQLVPLAGNFVIAAGDGAAVRATVSPLPIGVVLFAYFSGVVLLFGGVAIWRKLWFALALWLFVNPVPSAFQVLVDLPSQALGAQTARAFAGLIGVPVDGTALKLMFSPDLGIFIAPGCNGLRGAVTMGYLALVSGYLRKMTGLRWGAFVASAVALAYVFNLVRLCAVIGYYWFALRMPVLGRYGTEIDYVIGGALFATAAWFLLRKSPRWLAS